MKIVTGNEKGVTGVRMWPIHSNIELVAKPYKDFAFKLWLLVAAVSAVF